MRGLHATSMGYGWLCGKRGLGDRTVRKSLVASQSRGGIFAPRREGSRVITVREVGVSN